MITTEKTLSNSGHHPITWASQMNLELLPLIMNNIPQAVFWKDCNLVYLGCNQAFAEDAGFASPNEIIGKTDFDMPWKEQADLYQADDRLVLECGTAKINSEEPQTMPDGSRIWLLTNKIPVRENGEIVALLGMYENITARKQTEQSLQQSAATLSSVLRVAQMGYWEFDVATQLFTLNDQYYSLHGMTAEEAGGNQMSVQRFAQEFVYPEDAPIVGQATQQAIETTDPNFQVRTEARIMHADGKPRWVTVWFRVEKDAQGRTIKLHGVNQDITERKLLEQEIQTTLERRGLHVQLSTQVSQSIAAASSLEELYERVVTQVKEQFGYYHTQLLRYDPAQEAVVLVTGYGEIGARMLATGHHLPMGEGLIGTAAATGETVLRPALENDPDWQPNPLLPETKGEIAVPIKLGDSILGVLDVQSNMASALDADDQLLLEGLCGQIATAIDSTRLHQEMAERLEEINRLYRAMSHEGWQSYREDSDIPSSFMFDQGVLKQVEDDGLAEELFAKVPLTVPGGETIGSLAIADDPQRPISPDDQTFVEQVAEQVALALESARLFEQTQSALATTQESESRLSEALNIARLAHWEYDVERDIFTFNDHFYSIFHTTAEQVGGYELSSAQYVQLFVLPEDAAVVGKEIAKALESTERHFSAKLEHRVQYADGNPGYVSVEVHVERDENGKIIRWYGANQDITERKRAEDAIKAEQQRVQLILESVTIPMVITRLSDNHLTFVNAPALEVTQFKYEDVINQPAPNFYVDAEERNNLVTKLRTKGEASDLVVQLRGSSGEGFWALLSARVFTYQDQPSILTTFMDITDRIRAQEAVVKRAVELQTVARVSTTTATTLEPDRLLQSVVDLTKEHFGLYHAHIYLMDESWNTLLLAAGAGEVGRKLVGEQHAIPISLEQSLVARAARERRAIIVNDVSGEPGFLPNPLLPETRAEMALPMLVGEKVLGVFDVQSNNSTGFSDEDANIYITLASQVAVALQNARLYAEQAATLTQLRELDKLKSSFLANMSHELRTPLNSILGFTDVIMEGLDGPLTEHMDSDLRLIQKNGQHLLHLINDVLDMAKIEAGRMNLNPESFRAFEVLEEVTSITSTLASEKNLSLFIEEDADRAMKIYADRTRLRQVMINLVNNSIKFTDTGHIVLNVSPMEGARILISVRDTGLGIPPEKLEAIFQEFTQVDSSTTRKTGGTGLGLPISRRLVEMHGGRLWAESTGTPGEGSIFFVELPVEARITEVVEKQEK